MKSQFQNQRILVHQFHYSAAESDAITNQMIFIRESLADAGIDGEIFAGQIKGAAAASVRPFNPKHLWNCDLLLVHHSQGNPLMREVLKIEVPKALVYHNVTPAEFLRHDPTQAALCRLGRKQLPILAEAMVATFADSQFNSSELEALGFPPSEILPLYDLGELAEKPPRLKTDSWDLLFVGRVTPHKNQAELIKLFYYFKQYIRTKARLILVGGQDRLYADYLRLLANGLGLQSQVKLTGKISEKELENAYRSARAFVCLSKHEGYCIPVVEAMRAGLPVFASPASGTAETLGKAGVQLHTQNPAEMAEVIGTVLENSTAVEVIRQAQWKRLSELAQIQTRERVQTLCRDLVAELREGKFETPGRRVYAPTKPSLTT